MEDFLLKTFELGALGAVTFYLLIKGTAAIKELSDSNKALADSVKALSDKIAVMDNRVSHFESVFDQRLSLLSHDFDSRISSLENRSQKNF